MTTKNEELEYTPEQAYEDMVTGMMLGIEDLTNKLNNQLPSLTKNEMKRALNSVVNYPDVFNPQSERELEFTKNLTALHGLHLQVEIQALADLQKEAQEASEKGEL